MIPNNKICRLCYNTFDEEDVKSMDEIEIEILQVLLIKLDLNITEHPVICQKCRLCLENLFSFKSTCIYTEDFITPFIKDNSLIDMKSICSEVIKSRPGIDTDVCRLCILSTNECFKLSDLEKEQFRNYFPEINLNATKSLVLCISCNESQKKYFNFAALCMTREEKIEEYHKLMMGGYIYLEKFQEYLRGQHNPEEEQYDFTVFTDELDIKPEENLEDETFYREGIKKKYMCKFCSYSTNSITYLRRTHILVHKSSQETEIWQCPHCPLKTKYEVVLHKHIKTLHSDNLLYCANCDFSTKHKISMVRHVTSHQRQLQYCEKCKHFKTKDPEKLKSHVCKVKIKKKHPCKWCSSVFVEGSYLKRHIQIKHDGDESLALKCDKCEFTSLYVKHMNNHARIHEEGNTKTVYGCLYCNFVAFYAGKLKQHLLKKHDYKVNGFKSEDFIKKRGIKEKHHQCTKCDYKCVRKGILERHMKLHLVLRPYKCKLCPFETTTAKKLDSHQIHHKERRFQCELCPYRCKTKSILQSHMVKHEKNPVLYHCKLCSFVSKHKPSYNAHSREVHGKKDAYKCDKCDFETSTRTTILRHRQYVHIDADAPDFKCDQCNFTTKRRDCIRAHIQRVHPTSVKMYKCEKCSFESKYMRSLRNHIRDIHELKKSRGQSQNPKVFECYICSLKTKTLEYLKRHIKNKHPNGEREVYKCQSCSYETNQKLSFKTHQIVHNDDVETFKCNHCDFKSKYKKSLKNHVSNKHESWQIINQEDGFVMKPQRSV